MRNIVILASGSGTNAENIIRYFQDSQIARVQLVMANKPDAYVLTRAQNLNVPHTTFTAAEFRQTPEEAAAAGQEHKIMTALQACNADLIILAGFLLRVPEYLLAAYPNRIINIHPALLPAYGGKGMYGEHVHQAVIQAKETESGITIHVIDERYDCGENLFQAKCDITPEDTPETLAAKIHELEQAHFPRVIEEFITNKGLELSIGQTFTSTTVVDNSNTAATYGSGDMHVFATPAMVGLMENAALKLAAANLDEASATVGTQMNVAHVKASPLGATITATAKLIAVAGRKLTFEVRAEDEKGLIGEGIHERFVVNRVKFMSKL